MCKECMTDGACCKSHLAAKGVALLVLAAAIYSIEKGYLKISYPMLIAVVLAIVGLKKLIMTAMWQEEAPKKGKK